MRRPEPSGPAGAWGREGRRRIHIIETGMYSTCIFCGGTLGANESIEHFPVGSRLAFDAEKGRLWAVCPSCGRWNLTPLEERWEALEECERAFRSTTVRTSTENIGLARLRDGTELVRVGRPLRPEFAAWRYGAQFAGRRRRTWLSLASMSGIALGVGVGVLVAPAAALVGLPVVAAAEWKKRGLARGAGYRQTERAQRLLRDDAGVVMLAEGRLLGRVRLRPDLDREAGRPWALHVRTVHAPLALERHERDTQIPLYAGDFTWPEPVDHVVSGAIGLYALSVFMARTNGTGAGTAEVRRAVSRIERARSPERFLAAAEEQARREGAGYRNVWDMPLGIRLGLEMAAHEDAERRALEGDLAELERRWREAESLPPSPTRSRSRPRWRGSSPRCARRRGTGPRPGGGPERRPERMSRLR